MNNKIHIIRSRLEEALLPTSLDIIDESHRHVGHVGYQGGGKHIAIVISSPILQGLSRLEAHRRIYALLADFFPQAIHALQIQIF